MREADYLENAINQMQKDINSIKGELQTIGGTKSVRSIKR
jgi:hypothetical protein